MPYGLSSPPSIFQDFVNDMLHDFLGKFIIAYIDDILIYSTDYDQHIQHFRQVLSRLQDNCLYVKGEKYEFHVSTTS